MRQKVRHSSYSRDFYDYDRTCLVRFRGVPIHLLEVHPARRALSSHPLSYVLQTDYCDPTFDCKWKELEARVEDN